MQFKWLCLFILLTSLVFSQENKDNELQKLRKENKKLKEEVQLLRGEKKSEKTILERLALLEKLLEEEVQKRKEQIKNVTSIIKITYLQNTYEEAKDSKFYKRPIKENCRNLFFKKEIDNSILKITYCDNFYTLKSWTYYTLCIDKKAICTYDLHGTNVHIPSTFTYYVENIKAGDHTIQLTSPTIEIGHTSNISLVIEEIARHKVHPNKMK